MDNLIRTKGLTISQRSKFGLVENSSPESKSENIFFEEKR